MKSMLIKMCIVAACFANLALSAPELAFDFRKSIRHIGDTPEGYLWELGIRIPFSFSHSQSRIGVDNGNYIDLAARLRTSLHYRLGPHDWSSSAFLGEGYSMTPTIKNRFIKSQDLLRVESRYLYDFMPWLGFYALARMETSIFKSIDIDSKINDYELRNVDDSLKEKTSTMELHIGDPFRPLFFQEQVGATASILQADVFNWEARAALGFRQTIADNQRAFIDEINNTRIVRDLRSFFQIGPNLGTAIDGEIFDQRIAYTAGIDTMWPFWQRPLPPNRDFADNLIVEASAGIAFQLSSWSSLGYQYVAVRIPDIVAKFQQNHTLTLDITMDWSYSFGQPEEI